MILFLLWKIENVVFSTFRESLFEKDHSLICCNSLFAVEEEAPMSLCSGNEFVSPAGIIVFCGLRALGGHLHILGAAVVQGWISTCSTCCNSWVNSYIHCLLLIITLRFTCGHREIWNNIHFHWHLETTNSHFWLVNILLQRFDTS